MASSECGHFIKEEQRCVTPPHGFMMHVLVVQLATNPVCAGPAPLAQRLVITMELATAIAEHGAPRRNGKNLTAWMNAVLQWFSLSGHFWTVPE